MLKKDMIMEMRLWALEVLVSNLFAMQCASDDSPTEAFEKIKAQRLRGAKTQTFPGMKTRRSPICFQPNWNLRSLG